MATLNYATVYEQALAQKFNAELKFVALYTPSTTATNMFRFTGGKTFEIPVLTVTGYVDADRDSTALFTRNHDNTWESHVMDHDREWDTLIDPKDVDETNMVVSIANATSVFNKQEKIPEMDKFMASKLYADLTALGTIDETVPADSAAWLALFDSFMESMDDLEVPEDGRIMYVRPFVYTFLKNAQGVVRQIGTTQSITETNRMLSRLDDVEIVRVPTARMKTSYDFTIGAEPAVGAKDINMILVHPESIVAPIKVDEATMDSPSAVTKGKFLWYETQYWTAFLLEQRVPGLLINAIALV